MAAAAKAQKGWGSLFEEDYLVRTLGRIAHDADIALTELVANAWDAGAFRVDLLIPAERDCPLVVEDDGHGMTATEFKNRWMKLGYNRAKHQGTDVQFPSDRSDCRRRAYGRNGVGRHGLLCFEDEYEVETWRDGKGSRFVISTHVAESPFRIQSETSFGREGHGTKLTVKVARRLPDPDRIRKILSARFLHDPQFEVRVNGQSIPVSEHEGLLERRTLQVTPYMAVEAFTVDSMKANSTTLYQGIALWVNSRLVGVPSWVVGSTAVLDGRSRFAKQHAIVIKAGAEWITEIEEDWSRFKQSDLVTALYKAVTDYAIRVFEKLSADLVDENSEDAIMKHREQFRTLPQSSRIEVATFTQELARAQPTISGDLLAAAVNAVIGLERSRSGAALLERLTKLDESDIEGLDRLLSQWSVRDALSVLDEIDHRLAVIAAIEKLSGDGKADELHTLHPLVTQARWLFGPEYESPEYVSNVSLRTAAQKIFGAKLSKDAFLNGARRPDIVVLVNSTCSIVGNEEMDPVNEDLSQIRNILIIELKRGRATIGREEMGQAESYVEDFLYSGGIEGTPFIKAFVVGHELAPKTSDQKDIRQNEVLRGKVRACTYHRLTRTAHQRFFKLKEKIPNRYQDISGNELVTRIMGKPSQSTFELEETAAPNTVAPVEG